MKKLDKLPEELKTQFQTAHQRALSLLTASRENCVKIPSHIVNMRIKIDDHSEIKRTIIPDINVYIDNKCQNILYRDSLSYTVSLNDKPFPMGHVYSTGNLCLGSIFVPTILSPHNLMTPLETLFLHNDRVMHGNPKLPVTEEQKQELSLHIKSKFPDCPINFTEDYLRNDTLWRLGNYVLENTTEDEALRIMNECFVIIFTNNED